MEVLIRNAISLSNSATGVLTEEQGSRKEQLERPAPFKLRHEGEGGDKIAIRLQ